ncbi:hypothetical protein BKA57DRAFT_461434 [Linnemannia elongata]|nr:hypothetical protein BKA57DRAFT_461434 [Linnemannia elongata]
MVGPKRNANVPSPLFFLPNRAILLVLAIFGGQGSLSDATYNRLRFYQTTYTDFHSCSVVRFQWLTSYIHLPSTIVTGFIFFPWLQLDPIFLPPFVNHG